MALPNEMRLANLLVAIEDAGSIVGAIGLEVHARRGLVRSVVVKEEQRTHGIGSELMHGVIARASELGLRELFLLTETAAPFFVRFGFHEVDRSDVPPEIRRSSSFESECPDSAAVLCLELETRI